MGRASQVFVVLTVAMMGCGGSEADVGENPTPPPAIEQVEEAWTVEKILNNPESVVGTPEDDIFTADHANASFCGQKIMDAMYVGSAPYEEDVESCVRILGAYCWRSSGEDTEDEPGGRVHYFQLCVNNFVRP